MSQDTKDENKVESLFGDPVILPGPNTDLVEVLEDLLERAKGGEIVGIAGAILYRDEATGTCVAGISMRSLLGTLFILQHKLVEELR